MQKAKHGRQEQHHQDSPAKARHRLHRAPRSSAQKYKQKEDIHCFTPYLSEHYDRVPFSQAFSQRTSSQT